jgi:tRNA(fMet)-specific endonuclease VapC
MLDTNTCIAIIKERPAEARKKLNEIPVGDVGVSSVVVAELWYGVTQSQRQKDNEEALNGFLQYVTVLDWPAQAAPEYGRIRTHLQQKGTPIGSMDLLIAAHAVTVGAVLVTDNVREFRRVPKLKVENWVLRMKQG